ncbi:MAG: PTS system mannose/fructose/sorbose family transporter subunit IID [Longimicrobiales bacterium]|nr:PTS system mannose/fructose/sorbose family transporter subunit IID [Longimicrobiales bacterium]
MSRAVVARPGLSSRVRVAAFFRMLLLQGSWNYRTMLGSGFAFALLPALRELTSGDREALEEALGRHVEHFNAHPYLASVAVGAVLRMEADGEDAATIRKLKVALRGPLGSLGDALIWATVLPGAALASLALLWIGVAPWIAVGVFLLVFNAVHLGVRAWGFRAGLRSGRDVGRVLMVANLSRLTRRLQPAVVVLLGLFTGAVIGGDDGLVEAGPLWLGLAAAAFLAGLLGGHRTWRPAAAGTVAAIGVLALMGVIS